MTRKRSPAIHWRLIHLTVLAAVLFYPVFRFNFHDAAQGSPTAYLLLPLWIGMISNGISRSLPPKIIDDAELNWIATVSLVCLSAVCAAFVVPELATKAPLWHAELVPVFCILGACGAVSFGVRRVARSWPVAVFVVLCFPVNIVLAAALFGGTAVAYGIVALTLGCIALAMALRGSGFAPMVVAVAFVCGAVGVMLLQHASPLVPMLVPAAVAPTAAFVIVLATRRLSDSAVLDDLPTRSAWSITAASGLSLLLLFVLPPAPQLTRTGDLTVVRADWMAQLAATEGVYVRQEQTFDFAPKYLGDRSSAVRYRMEAAGTTAFVDVYTSARLGPLTNFRAMAWYPGTAATRIDAGSVSLAPSVNAVVSYNDASAAKTPNDPVWVAVGFKWRVADGDDDLFQQVRVFVSQRAEVPEQVPAPARPSMSTLLLEPLTATLRQGLAAEAAPTTAITQATDAARKIVDTSLEP